MLKKAIILGGLLLSQPAVAANLEQTVHFNGADAGALFELYTTTAGHSQITGLPAQYKSESGEAADAAQVGGTLDAFCFEPGKCGLSGRVLDVANSDGVHTITMSWWNFGWVSAVDPLDLTVEGRGAPDSIAVVTFRDTLRGAQVELVQVNVPDYKVSIPNPDQTVEQGALSAIVNTHWNTLYWDNIRRIVAAK